MPTFEQEFQRNFYNIKDKSSKSYRWFEQQSKLLSSNSSNPDKIIRAGSKFVVPTIVPGEMYLYRYDPKYKSVLPMWDMYPLVFPFSLTTNGFIGLNLHYLPYGGRIKLLDNLMSYRSNSGLTSTTKVRLSWGLIQNVSKLKIAEQSVHRYIFSQIMSPIMKIESGNWGTALMLPVEKFVQRS